MTVVLVVSVIFDGGDDDEGPCLGQCRAMGCYEMRGWWCVFMTGMCLCVETEVKEARQVVQLRCLAPCVICM